VELGIDQPLAMRLGRAAEAARIPGGLAVPLRLLTTGHLQRDVHVDLTAFAWAQLQIKRSAVAMQVSRGRGELQRGGSIASVFSRGAQAHAQGMRAAATGRPGAGLFLQRFIFQRVSGPVTAAVLAGKRNQRTLVKGQAVEAQEAGIVIEQAQPAPLCAADVAGGVGYQEGVVVLQDDVIAAGTGACGMVLRQTALAGAMLERSEFFGLAARSRGCRVVHESIGPGARRR
jgi:hypothetical protein